MSFQILDIVLYSHDSRRRVVALRPGEVSIITGASKTGKTALISIVDYCLGSSSCDVPEGPIRRDVSWLGLRLQMSEQQAFVARRVPGPGKDSTSEVFYLVGSTVELPEAEDLQGTMNPDTLVTLLSSAVGIGPHLHEPPASQTRRPLSANVRHALLYTFQPQYEINQPSHLFHKQSDNWVAQAIKDTLPYFLGAIEDDHMAMRAELRRLGKDLRERQRRLSTMESLRGEGLGKAAGLLAEAADLGLVDASPLPSDWETAVRLLHEATAAPAEEQVQRIELGETGEELNRLTEERRDIQEQLGRAKNELSAAKALVSEERGYAREVGEQLARLRSIGVLPPTDNAAHLCPLCESPLGNLGIDQGVRTAVEETSAQLDRVTRYSPQVESVVNDLQEKVDSLKQGLAGNREALEALRASSERLNAFRDAAARRAHVLGRITLYLESVPEVADTSSLRDEIANLKKQIEVLEEQLANSRVQERMESFLSVMGTKMTRWAQDLKLEHSEYPLRLDARRLTVVADTDDGPLPMDRMGSGENWVGYHVIAHLALHERFTRKNRPVPRFLFLDQPSQVYFPSERIAEGSVPDLADDDRVAVGRMFELIVRVVELLSPHFQVVITEHAELTQDWYSSAVVERWRDGVKLVPDDWEGGRATDTGEGSEKSEE